MTKTKSDDQTFDALSYIIENARLVDRDLTRYHIQTGMETEVYGPVFRQMVANGKEHVQASLHSATAMAIGLEVAGRLYHQANGRYTAQARHLPSEALPDHHASVLRGDLTLVDQEFATEHVNGVSQVIEADRAFKGDVDNIGYQAALAECNYKLFRDQTMTSGSRITEKLSSKESPYEIDRASYSAMSHLDTSNVIIGNVVEGIIQHSLIAHNGQQRIRIFDIGSGHGATIAGILHSIKSRQEGERLPEIAMTGIETTPQFFDELVQFVAGPFGSRTIGLTPHRNRSGRIPSNFGQLTVALGDSIQALRNISFEHLGQQDETFVVTANYVFHRLSSDKKREILAKFSDVENVVFVIGDLAQNTSTVNSRYFNLAANGPLNTGNRSLSELFASTGYHLVDTTDSVPASIDAHLASNITGDSINPKKDGHLWIATKGERALDSLSLTSPRPALGPTIEARVLS